MIYAQRTRATFLISPKKVSPAAAQVHNTFFTFDDHNQPVFEFKGKALLKGETDGSSYVGEVT